MNEKVLLKISLTGSILSLIVLYIVVLQITPIPVNISEIKNNWTGKTVNVTGYVTDLRKYKDHLFFNLESNESKIKVVIWNNILQQMEIKGIDISKIENGKKLEIIGRVELYKGSLEIVPSRGEVKILE